MPLDNAEGSIVSQGVNRILNAAAAEADAYAQARIRHNEGASQFVEAMRLSAETVRKAVDSQVVQQIQGTNPTLADLTLAFRGIQGQPGSTGTLVSPGVVSGVPEAGNTAPPQPKA